MIKKLLAGQKVINVGMAEVKMAFVTAYTIFVGIMGLVSYVEAHSTRDGAPLSGIHEYLICERKGTSADCNRNIPVITSVIVVSVITLSLFPVAVLFVTCDVEVFRSTAKRNRISVK